MVKNLLEAATAIATAGIALYVLYRQEQRDQDLVARYEAKHQLDQIELETLRPAKEWQVNNQAGIEHAMKLQFQDDRIAQLESLVADLRNQNLEMTKEMMNASGYHAALSQKNMEQTIRYHDLRLELFEMGINIEDEEAEQSNLTEVILKESDENE